MLVQSPQSVDVLAGEVDEEDVVPVQQSHSLVQEVHEIFALGCIDPREEVRRGVVPIEPVAALDLGAHAIASGELHVRGDAFDHAREVRVAAVVALVVLEAVAHLVEHEPLDFESQVARGAFKQLSRDVNLVVAVVRGAVEVFHDECDVIRLPVAERERLHDERPHVLEHCQSPGLPHLGLVAPPAGRVGRSVLGTEGGGAHLRPGGIIHNEQCNTKQSESTSHRRSYFDPHLADAAICM